MNFSRLDFVCLFFEQYVDRRWEAAIQVKWLALTEKRKMQKIQMEGVVLRYLTCCEIGAGNEQQARKWIYQHCHAG